MKKTIHISMFLLSALILLTMSCKKEPTDSDGQHNNPPDGTMKDVKIILPDGANYDLTGHEVLAGGVIQPVSKDGNSKVPDIKGTANIAYLFDKADNVVMAGFITDSTSTISAETTAKVILFYATSAAFSVDTIAKVFISKIGTVPETAAWMQNFSATWKANPLLFHKELT